MTELNLEKTKNILLILICSMLLLYWGRAIFIPLSFSILISFLLYPVCSWLERKKLSRGAAVIIGISLLFIFFSLIISLFIQQLSAFMNDWNLLKEKLPSAIVELRGFLTRKLGMSDAVQNKWLQSLSGESSSGFFRFIQSVLYSSVLVSVSLILVPVFSALILYTRTTLLKSLYSLFPSKYREEIHRILIMSVHTYYNFIKGMLLVYLIVGLLNSIGLLLLGIPHAFLFGFIASILTFIPFVGIIAGSLLPITIAWLTYSSVWYPLGVIAVFTTVQYLEAYLIFPLAVSYKLKISSLVTLISIIVGGIIWGAAGMILFIPFVAILKLIADKVPSMHMLSNLLGNNK